LLGSAGRSSFRWPVLTEVDLLLRFRGRHEAALVFARALHGGVHHLEAPTNDELATALGLGDRYPTAVSTCPTSRSWR
jgi:hypothetical protein